MKGKVFVAVTWISVVAGVAFAGGGEVFRFQEEMPKAVKQDGYTLRQLIKTPEYMVSLIIATAEIKPRRHKDGNHVLYIAGGRGMATVDGKQVPLEPYIVLHIPKGSTYSLKPDGPRMAIVDFAQPSFDPKQIEWVK